MDDKFQKFLDSWVANATVMITEVKSHEQDIIKICLSEIKDEDKLLEIRKCILTFKAKCSYEVKNGPSPDLTPEQMERLAETNEMSLAPLRRHSLLIENIGKVYRTNLNPTQKLDQIQNLLI